MKPAFFNQLLEQPLPAGGTPGLTPQPVNPEPPAGQAGAPDQPVSRVLVRLSCGYWPDDPPESYRDGVRDFYEMIKPIMSHYDNSSYEGDGCGTVIVHLKQPVQVNQLETLFSGLKAKDPSVYIEDCGLDDMADDLQGCEVALGIHLALEPSEDDEDDDDEWED